MKKFSKLFILFLFSSFVFVACNDEEVDSQKPIILLGSPQDHAQFQVGDEIRFDSQFTDDVALRQMKVDIHKGEGHDHKSSQNGVEWQWDTIINLTGKDQHVQFDILIPEDIVHGMYHFLVHATDVAGNEAFEAIEIEIEGDDH